MLADEAFVSFIGLEDGTKHQEYNAWHQLDHLPENLTLDEVIWGDRWVRSPDCASLTSGTRMDLVDAEYVVMYWLKSVGAGSDSKWEELVNRSIHWGRRPEIAWARRMPVGFFKLAKGYVSPRVLVSSEAIPLRPHRGVFLSLTEVHEPHSAEAIELFRWYDQERLPELLRRPGVAGAWTFYSSATQTSVALQSESGSETREIQFRVLYFDEDPIETVVTIENDLGPLASVPVRFASTEANLVSGPLRTISPWHWDWFDERNDNSVS